MLLVVNGIVTVIVMVALMVPSAGANGHRVRRLHIEISAGQFLPSRIAGAIPLGGWSEISNSADTMTPVRDTSKRNG